MLAQLTVLFSHFQKLIRFGAVGLLTMGIYYGLFFLFQKVFEFNPHLSITIAYLCAAFLQFFMNKHFSFGNQQQAYIPQLIRYWIVVGINFAITKAITYMLIDGLQIIPAIAMLVATFITFFSGYMLSKYWIFANKPLANS